jgi:hypothetical protein
MIIKIHFGGKTFLIGHGDGKGPQDKGYETKKVLLLF